MLLILLHCVSQFLDLKAISTQYVNIQTYKLEVHVNIVKLGSDFKEFT